MQGAAQSSGIPMTHELVSRRARSTPDAVAVVEGDRHVTLRELDERANQLAHLLREAGAGPEAPVGVCLPRGTRQVVALLAVWKAGAGYVPLDPGHPVRRTAALLAETAAVVAVTDEAFQDSVAVDGVRRVLLDEELSALDGRPVGLPEVDVEAGDCAYVLYTSGSTGRPKGVVISHAGIGNRIAWVVDAHRLGAGDRVLHKTPITFDAACWEIFAPLVSGGTVVLAPVGAERDPAAMLRAVIDHRITVLQVVPSVLRMLVEEPGWDECTTLRLLFCAGEPLHAELVQEFRRRVGNCAENLVVCNTYGPTECSIDVTAYDVNPLQRTGPVPIGTPIDGMRVLLLGPDGRPVPPGERGELCAAGVGVARGYLGRPGLTADRFLPDPEGPPGARLYRTGDIARRRADGNLEYLGRADHQVKINGVRIEPGEVEAALVAHGAVREAVVAPFTTPAGTLRLAAYVRLDSARTRRRPRQERHRELTGFLRGHLPESHLPAVYVEVERFPTTSSGKLDRLALPAPRPEPHQGAAPAGQAEHLVAKVWRDLLKADGFGVHDGFFELGGSSLQLIRLANRLRAESGRPIELSQLLTATTVAAQARLLDADRDVTPPVRAVPRTGTLPLSPGQRRLWVLDRIEPGSREWVTGLFLSVPAGVGETTVRRALDALAARHESLRTRIVTEDGEPVQVVDEPGPVELRTVRAPRARAGAVVEEDAEHGFDLERGPMVRAVLVVAPDGTGGTDDVAAAAADSADRSGVLALLTHHIAGDAWSATILRREFYEILDALLAERPARLDPLPVQYADYAAWQREHLTDDVVERELKHWKGVLSGAEPFAPRPDRARPPARDARGSVVTFTVPAAVARPLTELGQRRGASPFMTLLTVFSTLLARHTGQWDGTIGTPVAGRERPEFEGVVGFFLNSLVLRTPLAGALTFEQALDRVRDTCRDAFAHQDLPFDRLVAELAPERELSRTPLYQVAFDFHDEELTGSPAEADDMDLVVDVSTVAKTDLTLYMRRQQDGTVIGALEYATALFDRSTVERLAGHFQELLRSCAAGPGRRLDALDLLTADERLHLTDWSGTPAAPVTATVTELFEERAAATPDATALVTDGTTVSYAELDARANRLAHHLRGLGVGPESVVGVLLDRGAELPTALLAVWKAGGAYLPLDPGFPADRVHQTLEAAAARVLVTSSAHRARLGADHDTRHVLVDGHAAAIADESGRRPDRTPDMDQLAYLIYTSGSTGRPKGVQITHRGLANHIRWAVDELAAAGTGGGALFSSVAFDLVVPNLWAPLVAGQPLHLLPQDLDLAELGALLQAAAPLSFLKLTPGHLEILAQQIAPERMTGLAGKIVAAGEALPVATAEHWARALGEGRLINEYGPTEASVGTCVHPVTAPLEGDSVPIGRPLPGMSAYVLDALLSPLPVGAVGELYVGGTGVARGYAGQAGLTAERFLPDPYGPPGARLYRTGDLVRLLPGGSVDFVGRRDGQVKIRGYRVELGEIAAVLREHPAVRDAVAVTEEAPQGGTAVIAYWVPAAQADPQPDVQRELTEHCAKRLPAYMIPSSFTPLDALPLTANGKLDRAALPRPAEAAQGELVAPRGVVEERIAEIFTDLLGTPAGADSHFFHSGGNSILAIRLIAQIQTAFDIDFPTRAVFESGTVAGLAEVVEAAVRAEIDLLSEEELTTQALAPDVQRTTER
ncbi:amino acid adenylation domain-containing protein [Streptomyces sp. NPDC013157]|uniref:amino acid adenylation domain-containing protein n=1 Tax=Streptomyces sp. NPDC013157 TaxID=3364861 RepID=UPI0036A856B9